MYTQQHIILSYSSVESAFALKLAVDLKNAGVRLWIDQLDVQPEDNWSSSLHNSFNNSAVIIPILSSTYVHSQYCQRELVRAMRLRLPVVPVLLTPLPPEEWPAEIGTDEYIDFTLWRNETAYQQKVEKLVAYFRENFSALIDEAPDAQTRYLTPLIARIKSRNSVSSLVEADTRPQPISLFEWNFDAPRSPRRITPPFFAFNQRRQSPRERILDNFDTQPRLAILGQPGTGKSSLLEYLGLQLAYACQRHPDTAPLPVFIQLSEWSNQEQFTEFIQRSAPSKLDIANMVVLMEGLDVIDPAQSAQIDKICEWLTAEHRYVVTCNTRLFQTTFSTIDIPTITVYDLHLDQAKKLLDAVFPENHSLDHYPGKHLSSLICNPRLLRTLLDIHTRSSLKNVGVILHDLVESLFNNETLRGTGVPLASLEQALAELANQPREKISYETARHIVNDQTVLSLGERAGFLTIEGSYIRFSYPPFRSYFEAVWLDKSNTQWQAVANRDDFNLIILCLVQITSDPDVLLHELYPIYPELALQCLGNNISPELARQVLVHIIQNNVTLDLATIPDLDSVLEAITGILRDESWGIRQKAYTTLQALPIPPVPGITDILYLEPQHLVATAVAVKTIGVRALPTLIQHLQNPKPEIRSNVIWALSELDDKAAIPGLVAVLQDDQPSVVVSAIQALGYIRDPDSFPALVKMLVHSHEQVRNATFEILKPLRENAVDALTAALDRSETTLQEKVIELLQLSDHETSTQALLKATQVNNPDIQVKAILALHNREHPDTIKRLSECLADEHLQDVAHSVLKVYQTPEARSALAAADTHTPHDQQSASTAKNRLKRVVSGDSSLDSGQPSDNHVGIVDGLLQNIREPKWGEREEAVRALREYAKTLQGEDVPEVLAKLQALLTDDDWVLRWAAVEALAWIGDTSPVPEIIPRLDDDNWTVRIAAIRSLVEIGDPAAIDAIESRLNDKNHVVREAALEALGIFGEVRVVPALEKMLDDPDELLRLAAVQALAHINQEPVIAPLRKALRDRDKYVRWTAVNGLRDIADESLVNILIELLFDCDKPHWENERICDVAAQILQEIGTEYATETVQKWKQDQSD